MVTNVIIAKYYYGGCQSQYRAEMKVNSLVRGGWKTMRRQSERVGIHDRIMPEKLFEVVQGQRGI